MKTTRDRVLIGLAIGGLAEVAVGSHFHSLVLMASGFMALAAYCFLCLSWSAE